MSILTEILLLCDGDIECPTREPLNQDGAKDANLVSASGLRGDALLQGWARIERKDYCPVCAARRGAKG